MTFAHTLACFQIVRAVFGAAGQALVHLLIDGAAVLALPAGLAVALAGHAGAMAGAQGIKAVIWMPTKSGIRQQRKHTCVE